MARNTTERVVQITAAIDFGTTYSGYAYSYEYNQEKVYVNSNWGSGTSLWKVPTVVLFDENREFVAFGEEAENRFCQLAEQVKENTYYYFSQFKMELYQTKVINSVIITFSRICKWSKSLRSNIEQPPRGGGVTL